MSDLVYLSSQEVNQLMDQGKLTGPVHQARVHTGVGESWESIYLFLEMISDKFSPRNRFNKKVTKIAKEYDCNAVQQDVETFQMTKSNLLDFVSYKGDINFYRLRQ